MIITQSTSKFAGIAFALAALTTAVSTMAQERPSETRTQVVDTFDLDLATSRGVERLDQRLHRAVKKVCSRASAQSWREGRQARECRHEAWETVQPQRSFAIARAMGGQVLAAGPRGRRIQVATAD